MSKARIMFSRQCVSTHNKLIREKNWHFVTGFDYTVKQLKQLIEYYKSISVCISAKVYKHQDLYFAIVKFCDGLEVIKLEIKQVN